MSAVRQRRVGPRPAMRASLLVFLTALGIAACEQKMANQPRYDPLEPSAFFEGGQSARHLPPGTVARGALDGDPHLTRGLVDGAPAEVFPFPITLPVLERGQGRYNIYCSPCHSRTGDGDGMIVRRGFTRPASFHSARLRQVPPGYIFTVITNGFGAMPSYRAQVTPADRWAITAYIQALQLSRNASPESVPAEMRSKLMEATPR